jgi:hypothetical protein
MEEQTTHKAHKVKAVAKIADTSQKAIYAEIAAGKIPAIRIGRLLRIPDWWVRQKFDQAS